MLRNIISYTIILFFLWNCCSKELNNKTVKEIPITIKDSILESLNSSEQIVFNSPSFIEYKIPSGINYSCQLLGYERIATNELVMKDDSGKIYIKYIYYSNGCIEYLPHIIFSEKEMKIKLLEVVDVSLFKTEKDYSISYLHKTCENNMEIDVVIEKSAYKEIDKINFNNMETLKLK